MAGSPPKDWTIQGLLSSGSRAKGHQEEAGCSTEAPAIPCCPSAQRCTPTLPLASRWSPGAFSVQFCGTACQSRPVLRVQLYDCAIGQVHAIVYRSVDLATLQLL